SAPRSRQPPTSSRAPDAAAPAANSVTKRVLPIPASPPMSTVDGPPARARSRAASRMASSSERPTRTGLLMRALTSSRMPSPSDVPAGPTPALPAASPVTRRAATTMSRDRGARRPALTGRGRLLAGGTGPARRRPGRLNTPDAQRRQCGGHQFPGGPGGPGVAGLLDPPLPFRPLLPVLDPVVGQDLHQVRMHRFPPV